jgi:hypothetical protein
MAGSPVVQINTVKSNRLFRQKPVAFVLGSPDAVKTQLYSRFYKAAYELHAAHDFALISKKSILALYSHPAPFIAKVTNCFDSCTGSPLIYTKVEDKEEPIFMPGDFSSISRDDIIEWVNENAFPIFSQLGTSNFFDTANSGRLLAVAMVNPSDGAVTNSFKRDMRTLARASSTSLTPEAFAKYITFKDHKSCK